MQENIFGKAKLDQCVQKSYEQDGDDKVPGLPVLGRELEWEADTQEALQGDGHGQPAAAAEHEVEWVKEVWLVNQKQVWVIDNGEERAAIPEAAEYSGDGNGVEGGGEEDSRVEDREDAKEAVEAGLGLDSGENKDVGQIQMMPITLVVGMKMLAKNLRLLTVDDGL